MISGMRAAMEGIESVLRTVAAGCLLMVMIIVFVDVGARYLVNAPLAWSYELIGMYLMPALFYLALSDTLAENHHIAVDLLRPRMAPWLVRIIEIVGNSATLVVFLLIAWIFLQQAIHAFRTAAVTMGVVEWPAWIPAALIVVGTLAICLRLAGRVLGHAMSLVAGHPLIELPPTLEG